MVASISLVSDDPRAENRRMRLIPYRRLLTVSLAALVTFSVGLVAAVFQWNKQSNARELVESQVQLLSMYFDQSIGKVLDVATVQTRLMAGLLRNRVIDPEDANTLVRYWIEALKVHPRVSYFSIGRESDGAYVHVTRLRDGRFSIRLLNPDPETGRLQLMDFWPEDFPDRPYFEKENHPEGDPRTRPYYRIAKERRGSHWTEAYPFHGAEGREDTIGITFATPFYDEKSGGLVAVLSVDFDLTSICKILEEEVAVGYPFILERGPNGTRSIVAHPDPAVALSEIRSRSGIPTGPSEKEAHDPVAERFRDLLAAREKEKAIEPQQIVSFNANETEYLGTHFGLGRSLGLKWDICFVIPRASAFSFITLYNFIAGAVALFSLATAIRIGFWLAGKVSAPLSELAEEARRIGGGRFEANPSRQSSVREIQELIQASEDMKAGLRSFEKYAPKEVVRELVAIGKEASLGGERRNITILFADMASFTSLSETLPPEDLVRLLERFHTLLAESVNSTGGIIDKLIGDAAMALWGAPTGDSDHAWNACRAALMAQERIKETGVDLKESGLPELDCRIGIQSGEAIVGNMGTETRMDYTAIGDNVNVASRLEGLNKVYGTRILIGAGTYENVKERIVVRPIDRIAVKGKQQGSLVYEILGLPDEVDAKIVSRSELYESALDLYFAQDWQAAILQFEEFLKENPEDGPARLIAGRCRVFSESPPAQDWDGVFRPSGK